MRRALVVGARAKSPCGRRMNSKRTSKVLVPCWFLQMHAICRKARRIACDDDDRSATHTRRALDVHSLFVSRTVPDSEFCSLCCTNSLVAQIDSLSVWHRQSHHHWLGGQNGEEGKVEDEVRGEEDGAQDRQEEDLEAESGEVTRRVDASVFDSSRTASHRSARLRSDCRKAIADISPVQVDDGGRRRNRGSVFAGSALEPTCKSVSCSRQFAPRLVCGSTRSDKKAGSPGKMARRNIRALPFTERVSADRFIPRSSRRRPR
jgi:hypothetical protein